jgi:hypothetical protein
LLSRVPDGKGAGRNFHSRKRCAPLSVGCNVSEQTAKEFVDDAMLEAAINAEIEQLASLPPSVYLKKRRERAKHLNMNPTDIDRLVRAHKRAKKLATSKASPDELRPVVGHIIEHLDILNLFAAEFNKVIAGEVINGKLLYLVATSRLFDKPMSAAIKGTSAGGKSEIRKRVLEFFPSEDIVSFTSLSDKALIYYDGDFVHKILSMGEAAGAEEQSFQDYCLRELITEGRIRYPVPQKIGNEIITVMIEKQGPVSFLVTTTKNALHAENETRLLSLEIDDSESQTKKVLTKVAQVDGLRAAESVDYKSWQDFQRWLSFGECQVVVPFAAAMVELIPPVAVRLRRDAGQVIRAIQAHALLHREQRGRDDAGRIVADIDHDYEIVRTLMNAIIAEGSGVAINPAITETIDAVVKATIDMAEAEGASAKAIGALLKLDRSAAWRRLLVACGDGYVVNLEQRKGMPGKYRVTGQKVEPINILPNAANLAEQFSEVGVSPPKTGEPCNRDEITETSQSDNGCKAYLQPDATEQPMSRTGCTVAAGCKRPLQPTSLWTVTGNRRRLHGCTSFRGRVRHLKASP